jgi:hypothetical protein
MNGRRASTIAAVAALAALPLAAQAAKPPKPATGLTLVAKPSRVAFGNAVTLSGKLTDQNAAGRNIVLEADEFPYEGNFRNVGNTTTNGGGQYSLATKPAKNTRYRARQGNRTSPVVTEAVGLRVSLGLSDSTPTAGQRVRFSGKACPEHDGAIVRIQRRRSNGSYGTVKTTSLKDIPGSTCSKYSTRVRVSSDGRFRTVVLPNDPAFVNGISRSRFANAH